MKFRTDPCEQLLAIDSGRTTLRRTSLEDAEDGDDMGNMDAVDDRDPSDVGRTLIGRWLSQHPEIAVIDDGVDRTCDDGPFLDEDLPSDIEALNPTYPDGPRERQPKRSGQTTIPRPTMLTAKTMVRTTGTPAA
jgi:hypothetical protein